MKAPNKKSPHRTWSVNRAQTEVAYVQHIVVLYQCIRLGQLWNGEAKDLLGDKTELSSHARLRRHPSSEK